MSSPLVVIHLVHGTWGRGVAPVVREELGAAAKPRPPFWFEAGSAFRSELAGLLADTDVEFREFIWSGSNSFRAWTFASDALREYLKPELARPQTQHVLIGHSHAGNVIFEALTAADPLVDAERLAGVLSLATPYLAIETETDGFNLLLHALLPLILGGYALALIVFNAAFGHRDTAGWLAASAVAYVAGFMRLKPQSGWQWPREFVFWAAAIFAAVCVGDAVLPWFATNYPADSLYGVVLKYATLPAACTLGVTNLALLVAARAAGSTPPGTYLLRDLVHALAAVYACVVLLVASVWFMFEQTPWAAWFWVALSIWPFAALGVAARVNGTRLRKRAIDLWRERGKELEQVTLPCELHAMRLPSDEASLAITASQLVRATTGSPRQVLEWVSSWRAPAATLVAVTLVIFGASIGYLQLAGWASGWFRFALGCFLGMSEVALLSITAPLLAIPFLLLFATLSYGLVGLAVGTEVFELLPAVRIACEPLPRGPSDQLRLTLLWPDPEERKQLPLRHSMYDLPSVQARVAQWVRQTCGRTVLKPPFESGR